MSSILKANSLSKAFKNHNLFSDFTYNFEIGNLYVFQGKSGCGKSTMLLILSGYLKSDFGNVIINKKDVSYLPTDNNVFLNLTIEENLKLVSNNICDIKNILLEVGLSLPLNTLAKNLSKGESVRLGIARMILENKKIMIFDEPTGNLDAENTRIIFELLNKIKKNHIIIISSHDTTFLKDYSDVIFTYSNGNFIENKITNSINNNDDLECEIKNSNLKKITKPIFRFINCLFKKNIKQNLILTILSTFLLFCTTFCLSFTNSDLNKYIYKNLSSNDINGVIVSPIENETNLIANSLIIQFENSEKNYFAISNKSNTFHLNDYDLICTKDNGIIIPSNIAKELDISTNSTLFLKDINESLVVENVYEYKIDNQVDTKLNNSFNLKDPSIILDYNYPIFISNTFLHKFNIETVKNVYASTSLFKNSTIVFPAFLNDFDNSTYQFWMTKKEYDKTLYYSLFIVVVILFIVIKIWLFTSIRGFKNEIELFHYIYGNNHFCNSILILDLLFKSLFSFLISSITIFILNNQLNKSVAAFFMIKPIIPIFQNLFLPSLLCLGIIMMFNIISIITCILLSNISFKNIINRKK